MNETPTRGRRLVPGWEAWHGSLGAKTGLLLLLLSLPSLAQDAGADALYARCPGAPPAVALDGGWWLPGARGPRLACLLETCEARRVQLEAQPGPPTWFLFAAGLAVGLSVGVAVGRAR